MVKYRALMDYTATRSGHRIACRAGDVIDVEIGVVGDLVRDCPGLADWYAPLTPQQAQQAVADLEEHARLAAEQQQDKDRIIRAHIRRMGDTICPVHGPVYQLDAIREDDEWRITCPAD